MIELLGEEQIKITPKQMTELLNLVTKEEILEMEEKVEKALSQTKTAAAHAAAAAVNVALRSPSNPSLVIEQVSVKEAEDAPAGKNQTDDKDQPKDTTAEKKRASGKQTGSP